MAGYFDWSNFGTGAQQTYTGSPNWGGGEMSNPEEQQLNNATTLFKTQFQNLMGRAPTADELGAFQVNAVAPNMPQTYQDASGLAQSYITNQFAPQIAQYQQQQQAKQLQGTQDTVQQSINQTLGNTAKQFSDPTSQLYQTLAGSMNNLGITPGSGAFQAGAGSTIANAGLNEANQALSSIGIPTGQTIQGLTGFPLNQAMSGGSNALGNLENQFNFTQESQLAQQLQQMMQPSGAQNILGMAGSAGQALGGLGMGIGGASAATWICTAMREEGILTSQEVELIHDHLYRAFWSRPWKFLKYFLFGRCLVYLAAKHHTDWRVWKVEFYDRVMAESDPAKAVDLYEEAFWNLYRTIQERSFSHAS